MEWMMLMIPILALSIPIVAIVAAGVVKLQRVKMEGAAAPELLTQMDELREELHAVRGELAEVQERLDFTERLLASRSE